MREYIQYSFIFYVLSVAIFYLFYHHLLVSAMVSLISAGLLPFVYKKNLIRKRQLLLQNQFKDLLDVLVSALEAGYSLESALYSAQEELKNYDFQSDMILKELERICNRLSLGISADILLEDFGKRSGVEEILTFSRIYKTARKSGGNLIAVMKRTGKNISEKIEIKNEIETMITGKKLEAKCMMVVPLFILAYMQISSPGFLEPLYSGIVGHAIMTMFLLLYLLSLFWLYKIVTIKF